jgi:hypothetical protein
MPSHDVKKNIFFYATIGFNLYPDQKTRVRAQDLNAIDGTVGAFRITPYGLLKDLGTTAGLPLLSAQSIAVR